MLLTEGETYISRGIRFFSLTNIYFSITSRAIFFVQSSIRNIKYVNALNAPDRTYIGASDFGMLIVLPIELCVEKLKVNLFYNVKGYWSKSQNPVAVV